MSAAAYVAIAAAIATVTVLTATALLIWGLTSIGRRLRRCPDHRPARRRPVAHPEQTVTGCQRSWPCGCTIWLSPAGTIASRSSCERHRILTGGPRP